MVKLGGATVGIDPRLVGQLARSLHTALGDASEISRKTSQICARAGQAVVSASPPGTVSALSHLGGAGAVPPADGGALQAFIQQAPPVAAEIQARLRHFQRCETANLPIGRWLWFTDEPLPARQVITGEVAFFTRHINDYVNLDPTVGAREILRNWERLPPAELDAVLNSLDRDQLTVLNSKLGHAPDASLPDAFANLILSSAAPATAARIQPQLTELKLNPDTEDFEGSDYTWVPLTGPLFGPHGLDPDHAYKQIYGPDCFFAVPLLAIAYKDPHFIKRHIWLNDNGTSCTVRLYQGGQPVDVVVPLDAPDIFKASKKLWNMLWRTENTPEGHAQLKWMFSPKAAAIFNPNRIFSDGTWAVLYEKAFAQLNGGYQFGNGAGGYLHTAVSTITGRDSSGDIGWLNPGSAPSLASIQEKLQQGHIMAVSTNMKLYSAGDRKGEKLVPSHDYSVRSVYTDPVTKQQMIELVNPLGRPSAGMPAQYLHLTEAEFQKYCNEMIYFPPPKG